MRVAGAHVVQYGGETPGARGATARWTSRIGLLLQIRDEDGRVGQGEASPLPGYSPDTVDDAESALRATDFGTFPEVDPGEPGASYLARLAPALAGLPVSARFAVEMAILDLVAQRRGVPVWALLRDGARRDALEQVPLCAMLGGADDPDVVGRAREAKERGVRAMKVKIAGPVVSAAHLDTLHAVRAAIGSRPLRLDANRTLATDTARGELERLAVVRPELVEEPVATADLATLRDPKVSIALDESLQDEAAWENLARNLPALGCVALVLKPMALGGFGRCLALARQAQTLGIDVTVSHLFDGPVALTAATHLAIAVASRTRASGLDRHAGLLGWPAVEIRELGPAWISVINHPGLGLSPLPEPA